MLHLPHILYIDSNHNDSSILIILQPNVDVLLWNAVNHKYIWDQSLRRVHWQWPRWCGLYFYTSAGLS